MTNVRRTIIIVIRYDGANHGAQETADNGALTVVDGVPDQRAGSGAKQSACKLVRGCGDSAESGDAGQKKNAYE